nr:hypothetical protein [Tanacetum cinerariifolium]
MVQQLGEGSAIPTDPQHTHPIIQPSSSQPQNTQKPRKPTRKDTQIPKPSSPTESVTDEVVHKEFGDRLVKDATTASSLEAEKDSGNITKTQSKETPNEPSSQRTNSVGGPSCQETIRDTIAQTSLGEDASKQGRIDAINVDEDITLVSVHDDTNKEMFDVDTLNAKEVFVAGINKNVIEEVTDGAQVSTTVTTVTINTEEITLDQSLEA